jgi:hypothetical protein
LCDIGVDFGYDVVGVGFVFGVLCGVSVGVDVEGKSIEMSTNLRDVV